MHHIPKNPLEKVSHNPEITKTVFLRYGDLGPITQFARSTFTPGQVAPSHAHPDMHEVFHIESGTAQIIIDEKTHSFPKGSTVIIHANEHHEVSNPNKEDLELIYFGIKSDYSESIDD